ncbi:MAG: flagellar L-ring protein [Magnetococcales bacterium]|nr:flagellar L-ring protein [Magnetococcales bacterium]HIJ83499.1 flagellar basal body L-ring protein FlgH [Magnetococcales bacterium]
MKYPRSVVPIILVAAATLSGCGMTRASARPPEPVAIIRPTPPEVFAPNKGSIWQSSRENALFEDKKARYVGDIVKVTIQETQIFGSGATTNISKKDGNSLSLTGGLPTTNLLKGDLAALADIALDADGNSNAVGNNSRRSNMRADVSCIVTEVLANGNMRIEGRRDMTIGNENQFLIISGIVRPDDITAANTVSSEKIADSRIEYSGEGDISDVQRPNMFFRALSTLNIL